MFRAGNDKVGRISETQRSRLRLRRICVSQPKIAKNSLKTLFLGFKVVQGHRYWYHSSAVLVMISSKSVSICNRFHARWANSGKITISNGGTPLWCARSRGISSPSGTKLPHMKLETLGYHTVKIRSLYLTWPWIGIGLWRKDRRTDRIPIASTRSQQYLPVQLWRVKNRTSQCRFRLSIAWSVPEIFAIKVSSCPKSSPLLITLHLACRNFVLY